MRPLLPRESINGSRLDLTGDQLDADAVRILDERVAERWQLPRLGGRRHPVRVERLERGVDVSESQRDQLNRRRLRRRLGAARHREEPEAVEADTIELAAQLR